MIVVVVTAMTAVVTAVTTTAVSGMGIFISMTGILSVGGSGVSVVSFSSASVSSGRSRSAGGITIGLYDGIRAEGGLKSIVGRSKALGSFAVGICIDILLL